MNDCIFCKIINKEAESQMVYEDESVVAFRDIRPKAPTHILVVPKKHFADLNAATEEDTALLGKMMLDAAKIATQEGIDQSGYKVITNIGDDGGQIIHHYHIHVVGGEPVKVVV